MLLNLRLPGFDRASAQATIRSIHAAEGSVLAVGAPVMDIEVDFSGGVAYDCPPVSQYRLSLREPGRMVRLEVKPGDKVGPEAVLALLRTAPDDDLSAEPSRDIRTTLSSIVGGTSWWDDPA